MPETSNFCVKARYVLRPDRKSIDVFNYANKMMVNGKKQGIMLRGKLNQGGQRKLSIGPTFIPSFFFGPYWYIFISFLFSLES